MSKKWDADWLVFSKKARRGAYVFLVLFLLLVFGRRVWTELSLKHDYSVEYTELLQREGLSLENQGEIVPSGRKQKKPQFVAPDSLFDPNLYSQEDWMGIGLTQKQAASILKYKSSGAVFRVKSDIKKLFVINDELYQVIKDKITLPDSLSKSEKKELYKTYPKKPIQINVASEKQLQYIRGIGPFYANKIIEYRNMLGGYHSLEQLSEINRLSADLIDSINLRCVVDPEQIMQLNLNKVSSAELQSHPYFRVTVARDIIALRNRLGKFKKEEDILQSDLIDEQLFNRLRPYITVKE